MFQPIFARKLSGSEEEALVSYANSATQKEAQKAEVILLSSQGRTVSEISKKLGFHQSNIKKWIRSFNDTGLDGIAAKKRGPQGGPRPTFTRLQITEIVKLSKTDPFSKGLEFKQWTPQKLASYAMGQGIVDRISHVTVRQFLKRHSEQEKPVDIPEKIDSMTQKAITYTTNQNFQFGKEAFNRSDYEKAVEYLEMVVQYGRVFGEEEAAARSLLSQSLEELTRYEEALEILQKYENAKALAELSPLMRARVKLRLGWVNSWCRNYPEAIASLNEAKKIYIELQHDLGVCESNCALGRSYIEINEYSIAKDHLLAAARLEGKVYNTELLAQVYSRLSTIDYSEGAFSNSKDNLLKALKYAESSTNDNLIGMILANLGTTLLEEYVADQSEAARHNSQVTEYLERAVKHLEKGGHQGYLATAYNNLGDNFLYAGQWTKAIVIFEKAIKISNLHGRPKYEATSRTSLAEILFARGQLAEAEEHLKMSLELISTEMDKWLESNTLRILGQVQNAQGKADLALKTLRETLQLSISIGDMKGATLAQLMLAEIHFLQGGYEQAKEYIELAQGRLKEEESLVTSGLIQRLKGKLDAASGRLAEAKQYFAQSISIFSTIDIPYELARSNFEMGQFLAKAQDLKAGKSYLLKSKEIFENLGTTPDIEKVDVALALIDSGDTVQTSTFRVAAVSDVLLMQRLIEASASSELLVRELTSIIYDNFPVAAVMVCKIEENDKIEPITVLGIDKNEIEKISSTADIDYLNKSGHHRNAKIVKICEGTKSPMLVYVQADADFNMGRLQPLLRQAELGLEICSLRTAVRGVAPLNQEQRVKTIMPGFIIGSAPMFDVIDKIQKIRTSNVTVLITGESGTGKELVARAVHAESARARAIFLPFNCTATPKEIIDSHLFGHRRGAFTGATENYPGIIRAADGGTLFLDEIGDLSLEVQPKLMRFLQESEIQPLGETRPMRVDVRVLAATNTDLERAVEDGRFRTDLFHRLNIIRIHVPSLRDRREEVPILATYFLEHIASRSGKTGLRLTQDAIDALTAYDWPGNVRQLRNEIERAVAYSYNDTFIGADDLSTDVSHSRKGTAKTVSRPAHNPFDRNNNSIGNGKTNSHPISVTEVPTGRGVKLRDATSALERQIIQQALDTNKNNLSRTALELGLSRRGLRLKLIQLGLAKDDKN